MAQFILRQKNKLQKKLDIDQGVTTLKTKTCKKLIRELETKGIQPRGLLKDLQAMSVQNQVELKKVVRKVKEGWLQKNKGMLQVLYERGWINKD